MIKIIETEPLDAQSIMDKDAYLLETLDPKGEILVHFYQWKNPSITYGYFLKPENFFHVKRLKENSIDIARRPTGGGIVFHIWDFAFSVIVPAHSKMFFSTSLENYRCINLCVQKAIEEMLPDALSLFDYLGDKNFAKDFCMAHPTKYDVVIKGKKIAGAAQRKKKNGFLHQGTIAIEPVDVSLLEEILLDEEIIKKMKMHSFCLTKEKTKVKKLKNKLRCLLIKHLQKRLA